MIRGHNLYLPSHNSISLCSYADNEPFLIPIINVFYTEIVSLNSIVEL
jgi:hypothetical protein